MKVELQEKALEMQKAVEEGKMLPERMELEIQKEQEMMSSQLKTYEVEVINRLQEENSQVDNKVFSKNNDQTSNIEIRLTIYFL